MSGIDNRIVTMKFDNRQFEQDAKVSLTTLQKIKEGLDFGKIAGTTVRALSTITNALERIGLKTPFAPLVHGASRSMDLIGGIFTRMGRQNPFERGTQGANELQQATQKAGGPGGMGVLEGGVTAVSKKFIALSTVAITALSNITNRAINAGTAFAKSFTVQPIMDGLHEYETNLKAIQTVQANTDRPLPEIERSLKDLNAYSDTTIYNFGEMAKNVGTFTAAGVNLKDSVASIKGIANVAALSGSSSEQAAGAMYQLSQAIAAGKVGAQDWNSVVNAGMAGKKLQTALARTAVAMGVLNKNAVTTNKTTGALQINSESFKNSIMAAPGKESWLTSGVLVNTLASLDGRFSVAYQKAQLLEDGTRKFTDAQIKSNMAEARANFEKKNGVKLTDEQYAQLRKMADASVSAAQDVKTLGQVFDIARETIGSGWSATFVNIFGNLTESKKLFTGMSNALGDIIRKNALARNNLLAAWKAGGGRNMLIEGLKKGWADFMDILHPIQLAFRDVFPKKTAADLIAFTKSFKDLMDRMALGEDTMDNVRAIARGVFSVFSIGQQILGGVVTLFKTVFGAIGGGQGDFLAFAGSIGDMITNFDQFLKKSGVITDFFVSLGNILAVPIRFLLDAGAAIAGLFGGFDTGAADRVGKSVDGVASKLEGLSRVGDLLRAFFQGIGEVLSNIGKLISQSLGGVGDAVAAAFAPENFDRTLAVLNTGLLAGIALLLKNFFSRGLKLDVGGGLFSSIKDTLDAATGAFSNMQKSLKADILLKIAGAIGVMALALLVLSGIDPKAMSKALTAMAVGYGILMGSTAALLKVLGPAGLVQLYVVTAAMTKMAFSILLLSFALKSLASIKFGDMLRGLVGLTVMLRIMSIVMPALAANSKGMGKASASLILMGIALNILAVALKIFATMSWEEMAKGLIMLTGTLYALAFGLKRMPELKAEALGLIALGVAMNLLAVALKVFATMSLEEMGKALLVLAASLSIIAQAVRMMPKTMMLQAVALVAVAGAMVVLAGALKIMGSMGWESIAKGMVVLAGALSILAIGLNVIGAVGAVGAAGLLIAATALAVLAPVIAAFGAMKWENIIKSLTVLVGIFTVLGVAATLLAPLVPVILALSAALVLLGLGITLIGAGAVAMATAITMVASAGTGAIVILAGLIGTIIAAIPAALVAVAKGIVGFAGVIANHAATMAAAMGKVLLGLLDQVIRAVPKIGQLMLRLVDLAVNVVLRSAPRLANAGMRMILALIQAAAKNVGKIVDAASDLVVNFLAALGRNSPRLINAGVQFIIKFINGTAEAIRKNKEKLADAGINLGKAVIEGIGTGISRGIGIIKDAAINAAKSALKAAKDFLSIKSPSRKFRDEVGRQIPAGMAEGISQNGKQVVSEITSLGQTAVSSMSNALSGMDKAMTLNGNLNPVISPVLDLSSLTKEANKMSSILAAAPVIPTVSYQSAADISTMTDPDDPRNGGPGSNGSGGDHYQELNLHLHSPKPIDSVETWRAGKSLVAVAKEAFDK